MVWGGSIESLLVEGNVGNKFFIKLGNVKIRSVELVEVWVND